MVSGNLKMPLDKIRAVLNAAAVGIYRIILTSGCKPRMETSAKMLELLGLERNCNLSEEEVYEYWFSRVCSDSIDLVNRTVDQITAGVQREVVYQWDNPKLGIRYVRCGGVCEILDDGTCIIEGYHSDITEEMDQRLRDEIVLKAFASIFYCLFYIDLDKDTYVAYFNRFEEAAKALPKTGCF